MKKTNSVLLSTPYLIWMVVFTLVPLGVVGYYALTDPATGAFTLGNLKNLGMYLPVLWKSIAYAEAGDQIPAEVIGMLIGHVFDKHRNFGCLHGAHLAGIAQFHRRFQHGAAHGFTHVLRPAEGLRHSALGNAQAFCNVVHGCHIYSPIFAFLCHYIPFLGRMQWNVS